MSNLKSKTAELSRTREELYEATSKRGAMLSLSHADPSWSSAKVQNLGQDIDKLQEKERNILDEISEIKHSPEFVKDLEAKFQAIATKRTKLQQRAQAVLDGEDPIKVATALYAMQDKMEIISLALENLNIAMAILDEQGRDIPFTPAKAETVDPHFKVKVPQVEMAHQRFSE
jgi:DNA repair exonuclease SbcCD ATPase subunit